MSANTYMHQFCNILYKIWTNKKPYITSIRAMSLSLTKLDKIMQNPIRLRLKNKKIPKKF